jgi:hypothetical protein
MDAKYSPLSKGSPDMTGEWRPDVMSAVSAAAKRRVRRLSRLAYGGGGKTASRWTTGMWSVFARWWQALVAEKRRRRSASTCLGGAMARW